MSQAALLKSFARASSNQALGGLTNGTKGAALEEAVEIARFNVTLGDLLLLRLELGAKAANTIAKQIKRIDLAVASTATFDGNQGACHLAKKLAMPLGKLGYYINHFRQISTSPSKMVWLQWLLKLPWDTKLKKNEWKLTQEGKPVDEPVTEPVTGPAIGPAAPATSSASGSAPAGATPAPAALAAPALHGGPTAEWGLTQGMAGASDSNISSAPSGSGQQRPSASEPQFGFITQKSNSFLFQYFSAWTFR
jgi:hypothetical protein